MIARIFVFMMLFSFQYVFGEEIDSESKIKFPYFYYHYSECNVDESLIDTLVSNYKNYSEEQQNQVFNFIVDSVMERKTSYLIEYFINNKVDKNMLSKQHKDKLMERTLQYLTPKLLEFWVILDDISYINPLHNWWITHPKEKGAYNVEVALISLGDSMVVDKWLDVMESLPLKHDTLDLEYHKYFDILISCPENKKNFDRLIGIMLKYPNKQMIVDYSYYGKRYVFEPISIFFYRNLYSHIKNAPKFIYGMMTFKEKDRFEYCNYPEKYKRKYLNWCKEHQNDYEFVE